MDALALLSQVATSSEEQHASSGYIAREGSLPVQEVEYEIAIDPALRTAGIKRKLSANAFDEGSLRDQPVLPQSRSMSPMESARALTSLSYETPAIPSWQHTLLVQPHPDHAKPEAPIFNETDGIIRCVCPYDDDDGFTIQCDRCFAWQHGLCVGISPDAVPEDYLCELCDPDPNRYPSVDRNRATEKQILKRRAEEGLRKARESLVATSAAGRIIDDTQLQTAAILLASDDQIPEDFSPDYNKIAFGHPPSFGTSANHKSAKRKTSNKSLSGQEDFGQPGQSRPLTSGPKQRKKPGPKPKAQREAKEAVAQAPPTPASIAETLPTSNETPAPPLTRRSTAAQQTASSLGQSTNSAYAPQYSDDEDGDERFEAWQFEYTPVLQVQWADSESVDAVRGALQNWFIRDLGAENAEKDAKGTAKVDRVISERSRFGKVSWKRALVDRTAEDPEEDENKGSGMFAAYDPDEDAALSSPIGPVEINNLPTAVKISVKPIAQASFSLAPPLSQPFSTASTTAPSMSVPYPRAMQHALFATHSISAGAFVAPLFGEVISAANYRKDAVNQYSKLGLSKPGVRTLSAPWSVVVDQRRFGNETRFARSGCHPNVVIRPVVFRPKATKDVENEETIDVTFALFALTDIVKREEIILPWEWDDRHVVHSLPGLLDLPDAETRNINPTPWLSRKMAAVSMTLFGVTACACEKRKDCALAWMWKLACASQPTGVGGNNRREIDEDGIEDRMVTALTGTAAGSGTNGKKTQKGKKPELGPLLELHRGWVLEAEKPIPVQAEDVSVEVAALEQISVDGEQIVEVVNSLEQSATTDDEEVVRPPKRKKKAPLQRSAQNKAPVASTSKLTPSQFDASKSEALSLPSSADAAKVTAPAQSDVTTQETPSSLGLMFDEPMPKAPVEILPERARSPTPIPPRSPTPVKEPTPPPKEPTPPPPPPRAKLSFAAFRQRLARVKVPEATDDSTFPSSAAPSVPPATETRVSSPRAPSPTIFPRTDAKPNVAVSSLPVETLMRARSPLYQPRSPVYQPLSPVYQARSPEYRPASPIARPDYHAEDLTMSAPEHHQVDSWRSVSGPSQRATYLPPAAMYGQTPKSAYFPPTSTFHDSKISPAMRYSSPLPEAQHSPPLTAPVRSYPTEKDRDRDWYRERPISPARSPPYYRSEDGEPMTSRSRSKSPDYRKWASISRAPRREELPVPQGSPRSPPSPAMSESQRSGSRPIPTGPSGFASRPPPAAPRRGPPPPLATPSYRQPHPSNYTRSPAVYTRPSDPIDAPKAPKSFSATAPRDRASWPPRDASRGPPSAPSAPATYRQERSFAAPPTGPSSRGRGWPPSTRGYRGRGRGGFRGGH